MKFNLGYLVGLYDVLRANDLKQLDKEIQISKKDGTTHFALGIYDEELAKIQTGSTPIKSLEDRMKIAEQLRGIDFVFPISSLDKDIVRKAALEASKIYVEQQKNKKEDKTEKKYKIAYAPGTFDLFHAGHLENLLIAAAESEFLVAGVKSDELVLNTKKRQAILSEEERSEILRHFKFVGDTYVYYTPKHLPNAAKMIKGKYGKEPDAIYMGSDLTEAVSGYKDRFNIIFTDRNPEIMKKRSTTYYRSLVLADDFDGKFTSEELDSKVKQVREGESINKGDQKNNNAEQSKNNEGDER